jgi:hypothetical protein
LRPRWSAQSTEAHGSKMVSYFLILGSLVTMSVISLIAGAIAG